MNKWKILSVFCLLLCLLVGCGANAETTDTVQVIIPSISFADDYLQQVHQAQEVSQLWVKILICAAVALVAMVTFFLLWRGRRGGYCLLVISLIIFGILLLDALAWDGVLKNDFLSLFSPPDTGCVVPTWLSEPARMEYKSGVLVYWYTFPFDREYAVAYPGSANIPITPAPTYPLRGMYLPMVVLLTVMGIGALLYIKKKFRKDNFQK